MVSGVVFMVGCSFPVRAVMVYSPHNDEPHRKHGLLHRPQATHGPGPALQDLVEPVTSAVPRRRPTRTVGGMAAKSDPAGIDAVEPLADSTARQARRLVAANAADAEECRAFLSMLGIGLAKLAEA